MNNSNNKEITKTWISGQNSCTLVIPKSVARQYGLDSPSHVVVEATEQGILIRKLEV
jgi:bifunctional DNA-binding transcriptional regulator/antitoxin component of YhaV-PrlF toxin-antitoxin module